MRLRTALASTSLILAVSAAAQAPATSGARSAAHAELATFSGGCFWCMQPAFDRLPGVIRTTVGYTGGTVKDPTYEEVSSGTTGHAESIEIEYDPGRISYDQLLYVFWHNVDPTDAGGQFCDRGSQYTSAIYYHDEAQRAAAERSRSALEKSKPFPGAIVTRIVPASTFYPAEDYHQEYYRKNPIRYTYYRWGCGRDQRLKELWGKAPEH